MPDLLGITINHRSMRGDARRFAELVRGIAAGTTPNPPSRARAIQKYLMTLLDGIHHHHRAEDEVLWPVLERVAGAEVDLAELTDDHAQLDPLLDRLRAEAAALAAAPDDRAAAGRLATSLETLRDMLDEHIEDEERTIFPIIERYVPEADWQRVETAVRKGTAVGFELPRIERYATAAELAQLRRVAGPVLLVMLALVRPGFRRREKAIFG
ncbi:hemerythrin domain-containing protein [Dactylosporangium sp. AC04546]|uniref:hemerythrin domain-containing protein n=1 Tax=Dactylosporangium sp. AC04546 TaxID=2862460 RepID=UPI001EE0FF2E|nr:hemerythrin domain-containing protein [Dactylosporangium sp. AC04546]WVK78261.1 hemerythrin domain-containing protein [Dactylosporangium sp. AC04546]